LFRVAVVSVRVGKLRRIPTAIGPEDDIVLVRVAPALKEIEKEMTGFNVDVSCVRASKSGEELVTLSEEIPASRQTPT